MTPERFAAAKALFEAVSALPHVERETRLHELTRDREMIAEVLALLAAGDATTHVSSPLRAALTSVVAPRLRAGDQLGVWRIEREIGAGGMGSVFLVERSDGHFKQRAALKFLKGAPSAETLAYFTRERQLLASLTHPNIARLHDGGATDTGQPYLVMEYVDGMHIDEHCRQRGLGVAAILGLFSTACEAVAFAHRQLIVHCDLKPSNLLIDKEGRPVLLDFGIARLAGSVEADLPAGDTGVKSSPFTPRYASPEQRADGVVSTASDIYSLGVLLGELLGAAPDRRGFAGLRGEELEAIRERATHDDPALRYATVDALIADIRRFGELRPLQAVEPRPGYATRKLLVRRWPAVAGATLFVVTVTGFATKVVIESQRALVAEKAALASEQTALKQRDLAQQAERRALRERDATVAAQAEALRERDRATTAERGTLEQRNVAIAERDKARAAQQAAVEERNRAVAAQAATRQTNDFLVSVFENSQPTAEAGDIPASKLLAAAEARLEKEMKGQPTTQATLYKTLAAVQASMGLRTESLRNAERALAIERTLARPLALAEVLFLTAQLRGDVDSRAVVTGAREALALYERELGPEAPEVAETLSILAAALSIMGKLDEAAALFKRAVAIVEKRGADNPKMADVFIFASKNARHRSDHPGAVALMERGLKLTEARWGSDHPVYLDRQDEYARVLMFARRLDDAERNARSVAAQRRRIHGGENDNLAGSLMTLAQVLQEAGKVREAIPHVREAGDIYAKRKGRDSVQYSQTLNSLATCHARLGDWAAAEPVYRESIRIAVLTAKPNDTGVLNRRYNLARAFLEQGKFEAAELEASTVLALRSKEMDPAHLRIIESQLQMLEVHVGMRQLEKAVAVQEALKAFLPFKEPQAAMRFERAGAQVALLQGRFDEARQWFDKMEASAAKAFGDGHPATWSARSHRTELLLELGGDDGKRQARELAARVIEKLGSNLEPQAPVLTRMRQVLEK